MTDSLAMLSAGLFAASDSECLVTFAGIARMAVRENAIDQTSKQQVIDQLYELATARGIPELYGDDAVQQEIATAVNGINGHAHDGLLVSRYGGLRFEQIGVAGITAGYEWFVEDVIPLGEAVLIFGDSGSGKSFDSFDMAMAGARGLKWNGFNVEPGLIVYVAAEAGKGFGKRKLAYVQHHKLGDAMLPFYLMTKRPDFFNGSDDLAGVIEEIKAIAPTYATPLRAIFLDTLSAITPGMNENAGQDVSLFRKHIELLREAFDYKVAIIIIHHKPKAGGSPRGHGSLTNDFETTIEFETVGRNSLGHPLHRATVRKQREGKANIAWEFTLPVVTVGVNKWGNNETSCVVESVGRAAGTRKGYQASGNQVLFMHALFEALEARGIATPPELQLPKSINRVVDLAEVRAIMKSHMVDPDGDEEAFAGRFRKAFKDAGDRLRNVKVVGVKLPYIWPTGKPVEGMSTDVQLVADHLL